MILISLNFTVVNCINPDDVQINKQFAIFIRQEEDESIAPNQAGDGVYEFNPELAMPEQGFSF